MSCRNELKEIKGVRKGTESQVMILIEMVRLCVFGSYLIHLTQLEVKTNQWKLTQLAFSYIRTKLTAPTSTNRDVVISQICWLLNWFLIDKFYFWWLNMVPVVQMIECTKSSLCESPYKELINLLVHSRILKVKSIFFWGTPVLSSFTVPHPLKLKQGMNFIC